MAVIPATSTGDTTNPKIDLTKLFGVDTTGGSTSSDTYVKIAEVSVDADVCNNFILVHVLHQTRASNATDGARADYDIRIGEASSEVSKQEFQGGFNQTAGYDIQIDGTFVYYYAPTTAEKTNGFNVQVYGKDSGSAINNATVTQLIVTGV